MIKKIIDWILGKSEPVKAAEAPYKAEEPAVAPEVAVQLQAAHDAVVASGQPDDSKGLDAAIAVQAAAPIEVKPVTVKAKYKRADLNKMTKAQLMELIVKHGAEVKARATKEELVKVLVKV